MNGSNGPAILPEFIPKNRSITTEHTKKILEIAVTSTNIQRKHNLVQYSINIHYQFDCILIQVLTFLTATICCTCHCRKLTGVTNNTNKAPPAPLINAINYTCAFPTLPILNVCFSKGIF